MSRRLRNESGQALMLTAVFLILIMGATGLTVDVGAWYHERRQAQTTADAAALSGAQQLEQGTTAAQATAQSYADQNGGGVIANGITFSTAYEPDDTLSVAVQRTAPGFFSRLFGIDSVQVHATASARSAVPSSVTDAAPIVVYEFQQMLSGANPNNPNQQCPCFGPTNATTIPLGKKGVPGGFGLVNFNNYLQQSPGQSDCPKANGGGGGGNGASLLAGWISSGYNGFLDLGCYSSDPGAKFNDAPITSAMDAAAAANETLLFPVYDTVDYSGSTADYNIVGWAAFVVTGYATPGNTGSVSGYFTEVNWDGIQSSSSPTDPDFGVHTIALVN